MDDTDPQTQAMREELERDGVLCLHSASALLARNDDAWRLVKLWRDKCHALGGELDAAACAEARSNIEIESELLIVAQSAFSYRQHHLRFGSEDVQSDVRARLRALCREYLAATEEGADGR
jgi:hypothetical protein